VAKNLKALMMSKSEAIRNCKNKNPSMGPKRIALTLNNQGYQVTAQFVSRVLSSDRRKIRGTNGNHADQNVSVVDLRIAKKLVQRLGGIDNARMAMGAYTELLSK